MRPAIKRSLTSAASLSLPPFTLWRFGKGVPYVQINGASGSVAALSGYAGTTVLRAGLTRAIEPEDDYVDVPASDLVNNQRMEGGDSGGPLTVLSRVRSDHRPVSPATYTREGVVIAVASGPKLFSSFSLDTACPCDFAHTSTHFYTGWLQDTAGGVLTWSSPTFVDTAA